MNDRASARVEAGVLARAVRDRRRALRLRQDELADLANCSTRFVHMLEQGKQTVRLDKLLDVLEVLGLGLTLRPGRGDIKGEGAA
jgi:y4mF family transcriptional regulator